MQKEKYYIVFAGVNGAGKSTFFHSRDWMCKPFPHDMYRVNSDEILQGFGGDPTNGTDQFRAMKAAVQLIHTYFEEGKSFNQETTLAGQKSLKDIKLAKDMGYTVIMFYLGVNDYATAYRRVEHRSSIGGHPVSLEVVQRRYTASLNHLKEAIALCDTVYLVDNSIKFKLVRIYQKGNLDIDVSYSDTLWLP